MYKELNEILYGYILEAEILFLRIYNTNPFDIMNNMSLVDLEVYLNKLQTKEKEQQESIKKNDIMKSLYMINQILSMMFYKK